MKIKTSWGDNKRSLIALAIWIGFLFIMNSMGIQLGLVVNLLIAVVLFYLAHKTKKHE